MSLSSVLPKNLALRYVLSYLTTHDWADCKKRFGADSDGITVDITGKITLRADQTWFQIVLDNGDLVNESVWSYPNTGTTFKDLTDVAGTLYTVNGAPAPGVNSCWIQQYPSTEGDSTVGRTVIEFYTDEIITAVFKTDNDNYGAGGTGEWKIVGA